jgi:hypothetical protein
VRAWFVSKPAPAPFYADTNIMDSNDISPDAPSPSTADASTGTPSGTSPEGAGGEVAYKITSSNTSESKKVEPTGPQRPQRPVFSGWCGPGPCRDTIHTNKAGQPVRQCRYAMVNGDKAPRPVIYCACVCHDSERDPADPKVIAPHG